MSESTPVIAGAVRTPTGKFLSNLSSYTGPQLGAIVIKEAVRRWVSHQNPLMKFIMGNVVSAGVGQSPARQAAIHPNFQTISPLLPSIKFAAQGSKPLCLPHRLFVQEMHRHS